MNLDTILNYVINGLFVGIGATLGNWLITKGIIRRLEKLEKVVKKENG